MGLGVVKLLITHKEVFLNRKTYFLQNLSWRRVLTEVNREYVERGDLRAKLLGRGFAWLDMGTHDSFLEVSNFVEIIEKRQGLKIACTEEIAYRMGYINAQKVEKLASSLMKNNYGRYLVFGE